MPSVHTDTPLCTPPAVDTALGRTVCPSQRQSTTVIEIHDHYAAQNGTWWLLCENADRPKSVPISITSFLHSVSVVIVYGQQPAADAASVNISVTVKPGWYARVRRCRVHGPY